MSQAQKNQIEQQYNDALNGDKEENKIPEQPASKIKDTGEGIQGDGPMTEAQRSYLKTILELHGEPMEDNLTKAEAAELIDNKKQNIKVPGPDDEPGDFWNTPENPETHTVRQ
jgi:hypothetical protein